MRLPNDYAAPRQEQAAVEYIWEQKGCVQQRREPIVRCRDCMYAVGDATYCTEGCCDESEYRNVEPDGFCANYLDFSFFLRYNKDTAVSAAEE